MRVNCGFVMLFLGLPALCLVLGVRAYAYEYDGQNLDLSMSGYLRAGAVYALDDESPEEDPTTELGLELKADVFTVSAVKVFLQAVDDGTVKNPGNGLLFNEFNKVYQDKNPSVDIDEYTFTTTGEEQADGEDCYVIEALPKRVEFYSKIILWIRKGNFIPAKADFYDPKGRYEKQGTFTQVKNIQNINTPTRIEMHNVQNKRTTIIELSNIEYDTGLKDDMFTERYMKRGK